MLSNFGHPVCDKLIVNTDFKSIIPLRRFITESFVTNQKWIKGPLLKLGVHL